MRSESIVEFGAPLKSMELPTPEPSGSQVLLKVTHCGVCHSDVHLQDGYFDLGGGKKLSMDRLKLPHTLGHEIAGEVAAMGPETKQLSVGDRRAVFPWIGCGSCPACERGDENLCTKPRQLGISSGCGGGFATHVLVPHPRYLIDYGSLNPALAAAYMCSGITAYAAIKKIGTLGPRDQLLVLGCGGVGLMGLQFAKALTGKRPIAADIDEGRLAAARGTGALAAYNTKEPDAAKRVIAETDGGAYAVIDFVGSESSFAFANATVRKGGRIVIVGLFGGQMAMPIPMFPLRAIAIQGSFVGTLSETEEMMGLVRSGKIDPIPLTFRPLEKADETLADLRGGRVTGRVVLRP